MKITLINPPWYISHRQFLQEGSLSQCLGLGYIASYLKTQGHDVVFIDALSEGMNNIENIFYKGQALLYRGLPYDMIIERIPADTELIGISISFTNLVKISKELCTLIKKKFPRATLVVGGIHPSTFPYDMLDSADYIIRGEGEIPMSEIASGKKPYEIKGLIYKKENSKLIDNGIAEQINNLDQIPFPYRPVELIERYLSYSQRGQKGKRCISIITSRGCPYDCLFCSVHPVSGYSWRARSAENVIEEIIYCIDNYGINHIEFEDDNLTLDIKRAEKIFDTLSTLRKKISWSVYNGLRVDMLSDVLIEKMKDSGCVQLNLAIESGNQKVLNSMNKKLSLKKIEEVVEICNALEIPTLGFFLVGYPGETKESFLETISFVKKLKCYGLKKIGVMIVNAYPGTKLYNYCKQKNYLTKDIDEHIFVDTDYVSVITEDFNKDTVIYWRDSLAGIFYPCRWRLKQLARIMLPRFIFKKLIHFYRKLLILKLKLNFNMN